ncbi:Hypothetical predicted protein [Olea europaea subsp. europaea]|uniref:Uncharacterized protein n=1 Tax=Olea europaea subsp. europaea TaxID=158383 RepID=A0A8S0TNC3_OLEEU|nr:Hypothetical predicted protein [Olea europaea subsp. europaea]
MDSCLAGDGGESVYGEMDSQRTRLIVGVSHFLLGWRYGDLVVGFSILGDVEIWRFWWRVILLAFLFLRFLASHFPD